MNPYNTRQLDLMMNKIIEFESKYVELHQLVSDLEGLENALTFEDDNWKSAFMGHWAVLEDVNAEILINGSKAVPDEYKTIVHTSICALKSLIEEKLGP